MSLSLRFPVRLLCAGVILVGWVCAVLQAMAGQDAPARGAVDPVAALAARLEAGATLRFDGPGGYLRDVLRQLDVREDSQVLVFSKSSLDAEFVSPANPRAIYFNDSVTVALTPGAPQIEFAAADPTKGLSFYTLDAGRSDRPRITPRRDCVGCHQGVTSPNVASLVLMSVFTKPDGSTFDFLPFEYVDHRTPLPFRWGGWYVTGTHGSEPHRGNAVFADAATAAASGVGRDGQNLTSLAARFDSSRYLAGSSDIVALLTLDHQAQMTNLMFAAIRAAQPGDRVSAEESARVRSQAIDQLLAYLLFVDAEPLHAPVRGVSPFAQTFAERGPRDARGRSLRDFDLERRLFRYPVSYLIYSDLFDGMPAVVRDPLLQRLYDILHAVKPPAPYDRLTLADRTAAFEILRDTKATLPAYWRE